MKKIRNVQYDLNNLLRVIDIIQPVTPTDEHHPSHWWNENSGIVIRAAQEEFIRQLKAQVMKSKTAKEARTIVKGCVVKWPKYIDPMIPDDDEDAQFQAHRRFWQEGFGHVIILSWIEMWQKFSAALSELD
jgi:signal recognition particle subunit SEC65